MKLETRTGVKAGELIPIYLYIKRMLQSDTYFHFEASNPLSLPNTGLAMLRLFRITCFIYQIHQSTVKAA